MKYTVFVTGPASCWGWRPRTTSKTEIPDGSRICGSLLWFTKRNGGSGFTGALPHLLHAFHNCILDIVCQWIQNTC